MMRSEDTRVETGVPPRRRGGGKSPHAPPDARTAWARWGTRLLLALALLPCLTATAHAQRVDPERFSKVKAAYLYNFIKFTTWPPDAFANEGSPIIITVVGTTDILPHLRAISGSAKVGGRDLVTRTIPLPRVDRDGNLDRNSLEQFRRQVRAGHVLFLAADAGAMKAVVVSQLRGADILTVSDAAGFINVGGMLELVLDENRVLFDANTAAIAETKVTVSSKVLRLARDVRTES